MKKKIVIDVSNLTISEESLKKTGIQEVAHQVLVNIVKIRHRYSDLQIILLPFLPEEEDGNNSKLFMKNPKVVLQQIESSLSHLTDNVWGFDLKNEFNYQMNCNQIKNIIYDADVFYLQSLFDLSYVIQSSIKTKFVSILYDITPFLLPEYANDAVVEWFNDKYLPSLKLFDEIISISRHGLFDLIDYGFVEEKQKLHFLQLPNYHVNLSEIENVSELDQLIKKKYFVVVGSIEPRKNVLNLIKGFRLFLNNFKDYYLVFIGNSGWKNDSIFKFVVEDELLSKHIIYTGYLDDHHMYKTIKKSKALFMVSNYEGFGLPLSLAASLGVKSLSNWGSSLPEASRYKSFFVDSWDEYSIAFGIQSIIESEEEYNCIADYFWENYCERLVKYLS